MGGLEMLEKRMELRKAMSEELEKEEVKEKFIIYLEEYDKKTIITEKERTEHRDIFLDYARYMSASGDKRR